MTYPARRGAGVWMRRNRVDGDVGSAAFMGEGVGGGDPAQMRARFYAITG